MFSRLNQIFQPLARLPQTAHRGPFLFQLPRVKPRSVFYITAAFVLASYIFLPSSVLAVTVTNSPSSSASIAAEGGQKQFIATANAYISDDAYAYTNGALFSSEFTEALKLQGFNFNIPTGATIGGVEVTYEAHIAPGGVVYERGIKLVLGNVIHGINRGSTAYNLGTPLNTIRTVGSATDTWEANLTPEVINAADFGVTLQFARQSAPGSTSVYVDHVTVTVHYTEQTEPEEPENPTPSISGSMFISGTDADGVTSYALTDAGHEMVNTLIQIILYPFILLIFLLSMFLTINTLAKQ